MSRSRALVLVGLIFVTGWLAGIASTHLFYVWRFSTPGSFLQTSVSFLQRDLEDRLELAPSQRARLEQGTRRMRERFEDHRAEMIRDLLFDREQVLAELESTLDPRQKEALRELRQKRDPRLESFLRRYVGPEPESGS